LAFAEELASEAFEQIGFDLLAYETEAAQLDSSQMSRNAKHELRRES